MKYSEIALKILTLQECGYIKSNLQFWNTFFDIKKIENVFSNNEVLTKKYIEIENVFSTNDSDEYGCICAFDNEFPCINTNVRDSEKPYLLLYRGNIELLSNLNNNVAVIGLIDPTDNIQSREEQIVNELLNKKIIIVSGLAKGCDCIAHQVCVEKNMPTIAVLPSTIQKIYPAQNRKLADDIVENNGLLITEYFKEPIRKQDAIKRFVDRDRLQAMFSKTVILSASYRHGEGDSGSRHAMNFAKEYNIPRYVVYNYNIDFNDKQFGLCKDLVSLNEVKIITHEEIDKIVKMQDEKLTKKVIELPKQISFL